MDPEEGRQPMGIKGLKTGALVEMGIRILAGPAGFAIMIRGGRGWGKNAAAAIRAIDWWTP